MRLGRLYAWLSYPVLLTALVSIVWGMCMPASYRGVRQLTAEEIESMRFFLAVIGYGGVSLFASVQFGRALVRCQSSAEEMKRHVVPQIIWLAASVALIGYGLVNFDTVGVARRYVLPVVAGLSGVWITWRNFRFVWSKHLNKNWWVSRHIESMVLSGIASHVAVAVVVAVRLTRDGLLSPAILAIAPSVPAVVGFAALVLLHKKYVAVDARFPVDAKPH